MLRLALISLVTGGGCLILGCLSLFSVPLRGDVAPLWPSAGWLFGCYWVYGSRALPSALAGSLAAALLMQSPPTALAFIAPIADTFLPYAAIRLLRRHMDNATLLGTVRNTLSFMGIGAALPSLGTAVLSMLIVAIPQHQPPLYALERTLIWFLTDFTSILTIAPALIEVLRMPRRTLSRRPTLGDIVLFSLEICFSLLLFTTFILHDISTYPLLFFLLPLSFWACLRLGPTSISLFVLLSSGIAIVGTLHGVGVFAPYPTDTGILLVQVYTAIKSATLFVFCALQQDRNATHDSLDRTQAATIIGLASLAETRDNDTGHHILRTRHYVRILAETLARSPRYRSILTRTHIHRIANSAPLHDIGKVGIPDAVLLKPARLSPEEFDIMKTHAELGREALRKSCRLLGMNSFLRTAEDIAWTHHERWDGTGYPRGIQGLHIPLSGRIMALADVYDALTSPRVYKQAMSHDKAREVIIAERGRHFDPDVVDAFLATENEFRTVAETLLDDANPLPV
nr:HD domain-containing phosphohydrolase [Desulfobaculum xiamenense]